MKKLEVRFTRDTDDAPVVGTLAEDRARVYFEYAPEFLERGWSLSPFRLPFRPGLFEHTDRGFGPLPGLFDDSLPDGWGLLLMDRAFTQRGLRLETVSPLDRLSWLGARTMGALTYFPPEVREEVDSSVFELHDLASQSLEVLSGAIAEVLPQLLLAGGSPGGARPKVLVGYEPSSGLLFSGEDELPSSFEHWIVKFAASKDDVDAGPIEHAYALMAKAAGIDMPPTRLFETEEGERFFGVKRFDRHENRRAHVHTFGNLIHADFRVPSSDYADLLKATSILTRNQSDVVRAFRQMVFNVASHNRDDHVKNFAFLLNDNSGELIGMISRLFDDFPGIATGQLLVGCCTEAGVSQSRQAARALRQAYPHEITQFLKYAQRHDLVHNPDDLWPDVDIMDETGEVDDIPF